MTDLARKIKQLNCKHFSSAPPKIGVICRTMLNFEIRQMCPYSRRPQQLRGKSVNTYSRPTRRCSRPRISLSLIVNFAVSQLYARRLMLGVGRH